MNTSVEKILHEVKKVIAGKDDVLEKIMMTVLSRGHVLLDDVPRHRQDHHGAGLQPRPGSPGMGVSSSRRTCCPRIS